MANATTAQPASAPATVESLTVRVAELERALATQKADTADVKRQLAAMQAEKVGWLSSPLHIANDAGHRLQDGEER